VWSTIADSAECTGESAYATLRIGASLVDRGRASEALDILDSAIHAAEEASELEVLAFALYYRGQGTWDMDDHAGAREYAERGLAVARQAGSRLAEMLTLRNLATAHASLGYADRAVAIVEQAAALAEELGAAPYKLVVQHCLAYVCTLVNQHERAAIVCKEAIELSRELGDVASETLMRGILGDAYQGLGRYSDAAETLERALPVCLLKLGYAYEAMGSPEAIGYLEESARIFTELRLPRKADAARQALLRCTAVTVTAPSPRHSPD
jgi:tetratricopeptide (TPR) repeat protein